MSEQKQIEKQILKKVEEIHDLAKKLTMESKFEIMLFCAEPKDEDSFEFAELKRYGTDAFIMRVHSRTSEFAMPVIAKTETPN